MNTDRSKHAAEGKAGEQSQGHGQPIDEADVTDAVFSAHADQEQTGEDAPGDNGEGSRTDRELAAAQDRILRLQAEIDNVHRRARRSLSDELRYAAMPLLRDLMPALDNVERAIEAAEKCEQTEGILAGFRMVREQLIGALAQHHCKQIDALGQPFDPNLHEAIMQQPSADHPPGTVILVTQVGYQLHDRVVRPSQVIVSTAAEGE